MPLVIDTDPGVDDAIAILAALAAPALDLRALTVVSGNAALETGVANAGGLLAFAGRDVPVHAGATRPLLRSILRGKYHGPSGMGPLALPPANRAPDPEHAVAFLVRSLREAARPGARRLTICAIGPLTNLALAIAQDPAVVAGIDRIVLMGGGFRTGGNRTPAAEFNILADPHAAAIVLGSGAPIVMAPLDVTQRAMATPARVAKLRALGGRYAVAVADLLDFFDRRDPDRYGSMGGPLHDPCTILYLLQPELFTARSAHVEICHDAGPAFGQTLADWWNLTDREPNAEILVDVDADGFFDRLGALLQAL
ncbi:MAG: nucleoside hydrolase [Alphaproteobacteria bacterium]|nr:nucleoside hydrolase [Alphaproteobacteria bacterium]